MASDEMEVDEENEGKLKNFNDLELDDRILKVKYHVSSSLAKRGYVPDM